MHQSVPSRFTTTGSAMVALVITVRAWEVVRARAAEPTWRSPKPLAILLVGRKGGRRRWSEIDQVDTKKDEARREVV